MSSLNARLRQIEKTATATATGSGHLVVFLEDGVYDIGGKTFTTLEDIQAEAARLGVKMENITIVQFVDAPADVP